LGGWGRGTAHPAEHRMCVCGGGGGAPGYSQNRWK